MGDGFTVHHSAPSVVYILCGSRKYSPPTLTEIRWKFKECWQGEGGGGGGGGVAVWGLRLGELYYLPHQEAGEEKYGAKIAIPSDINHTLR